MTEETTNAQVRAWQGPRVTPAKTLVGWLHKLVLVSFLVAVTASGACVRAPTEHLPFEGPPAVAGLGEELVEPSLEERLEPTWTRVELRLRWFGEMLPVIGLALAAFVLFWLIGRLVSRWELPFRLITKNRLLREVLRQIVRTCFVLVGLLLALELLDATALLGAVLGAAGVLGLALGFAFKDIIENYLASLLLSVRQPFRMNDDVRVGEHEGKVVRMTTRETILMTSDGNHLRLPNALVFKSAILNFTLNPRRRINCLVGIGTDESLRDAQRVGIAAIAETPGVLTNPPPSSQVEALRGWSVDVRFFAWVDQREADSEKVSGEARRRLKAGLDAAGISMPVPTQRLEMVPIPKAEMQAVKIERKAVAAHEQAQPVTEVAPDRHLDTQIAEDLADCAEQNLLTPPV